MKSASGQLAKRPKPQVKLSFLAASLSKEIFQTAVSSVSVFHLFQVFQGVSLASYLTETLLIVL